MTTFLHASEKSNFYYAERKNPVREEEEKNDINEAFDPWYPLILFSKIFLQRLRKEDAMVKIHILSPALNIREKVFSNIRAAVKNLAIDVVVVRNENQGHKESCLENEKFTTPVIIVNGEMKSFGRIPEIDEITEWLEAKRVRIGESNGPS